MVIVALCLSAEVDEIISVRLTVTCLCQ